MGDTGKDLSKIVLAYSGGLDTSIAVKWLMEEYSAEIVTWTGDVGQRSVDLEGAREKALRLGAVEAICEDVRDEFYEGYVSPAIRANALYMGTYPISTALTRPLIAKHLVDVAERTGADAVAHGCTGKGNDQVRMDITVKALNPDLEIVAPAREWDFGRSDEIEYAAREGIPIPVDVESPYSTDENLWGRSIECGVLEEPMNEPPGEIYALTADPVAGPDEAEYLTLTFEGGLPVGINGEERRGVQLVEELADIAGKHGVGRIDHMEDRVVGLKSREIYECPAATVVLMAHADLEKYVLTRREREFKGQADQEWTNLAYRGLWSEPLRESLQRFIGDLNGPITGEVRMKLYKGRATVVGRSSDNALYDISLATYEKERDIFSHDSAVGFIDLWGLEARMASRARSRRD
jgi:argininosuccinate synthase